MSETNQIKELFDNAVANAFAKVDFESKINAQIEKSITEAVISAVSDWEIKRAVEKKIKDAIHVDDLDFGNYGKLVENIFTKAVKDFNIERLDERLSNIAKGILGAPDKKEYDLWEDVLKALITEDMEDHEKHGIEEYGFEGKLVYEEKSYSWSGESRYIYISYQKSKYSSSSEFSLDLYKRDNESPWEINRCRTNHGLSLSSDTTTFASHFREPEKRLIDLVMKGCTLTNVEETLRDYCEEK